MWTLWIISIIIMAVLAALNYRDVSSRDGFVHARGFGFGDLFRREVAIIGEVIKQMTELARPFLANVLMRTGIYLFRKGGELYGAFSRKVFGRVDLKKGKTASFFIKHISEFKEELARDERLGV